MSLRSNTWLSAGQMSCCLTRWWSVRCSWLNEMPLLRAPENKRTGMEINPNVKYPDQTEAAIVSPQKALDVPRRAEACLSCHLLVAADPLARHKTGQAASRPRQGFCQVYRSVA